MARKLTTLIVAVLFILVSLFLLKAFLYRSDYFRLRVVETKGRFLDKSAISVTNNRLLNLYRGRNIFRISLKDAEESLSASYPDAKDISVRIALPDKLMVNMELRKPVAIVKNVKDYPIDEDGVLLLAADPASQAGLVPIEGISIRPDERRKRVLNSRNIKLALELLKELKASRIIKVYGIGAIDAGDAASLSFYLRNGIEIKIGCEYFDDRLKVLERTLKDPRLVVDKIKYIDVRFQDVSIGPK